MYFLSLSFCEGGFFSYEVRGFRKKSFALILGNVGSITSSWFYLCFNNTEKYYNTFLPSRSNNFKLPHHRSTVSACVKRHWVNATTNNILLSGYTLAECKKST